MLPQRLLTRLKRLEKKSEPQIVCLAIYGKDEVLPPPRKTIGVDGQVIITTFAYCDWA